MKTVLVTGASRGIGRQIAIDLAKTGYNVAITYLNSKEKADRLIQQYPNIKAYRCNVSSFNEVENLYTNICKDFGNVDMVVNNAGISFVGLLQDMTEDQIAEVISANLSGTIYSCRKAAQVMVKNHSGAIVNISSVWGLNGASCESVYSASKGGVIAFTKALAKELAPSGIRVNCVCPGVIKTDMLNCFNKEELQKLAEETPLGRLGTPENVSDIVCFLLSDKAGFITGQSIGADGGFGL